MAHFLELIFSFPVAVYTALLGLALLYWLFLLLGLVDLDGGDAGLEAVGLDAAGPEGAEVGRWAAAKGNQHEAPGGFIGIPAPIAGTFLILWAWFFSYLAVHLTGLAPGELPWLWGAGIVLGAPVLAFFPARWSAKPLAPLFYIQCGVTKGELVGRKCRILSSRVDARAGRAEFDNQGAGLLLEVRCEDENRLRRGSAAVLIQYDSERDVFLVREGTEKGD
ncbi:MAG: hypothetical protein HY319_08370 [Armatimonadetes bacterium]|nr:hypothetical protein [Armatimonadota bacterium]